ncbi:YfhO family protein [Enterococcus pingfangensis]|uniref:YfhO family protein n=1 Tax=Enterococcus pingfangensis TaxID=2559924 RepID=UPI001484D526|nr:YfhO family protein [Enterococcus pingfangensis]
MNKNVNRLRKKNSRFGYRKLFIPVGMIILFGILYSSIIFGDWKLSFANLMYLFEPFKSLNVGTSGPLLSDPADNVYPIAYTSIHKVMFSGWLSTLGIGAPQSMTLYLFFLNYLYLLPFDIAPLIVSIVKVLIAFISMNLLMKRWGYTRIGAFISAVSFALCSTMVMWHGWPHSEVTMLAPLIFLFLDLLLEKIKISYIVGGAIVIFCMLVAGMPTYTAYFMYLLGCYVLYYGVSYHWRNKKRLLVYFVSFALCIILGALLSLPYTAELLQTVGGNGYNESRKGLAAAKLDWSYLRTLFYPYIRNDLSIHINEATLYTGILSVITLPFSFFNIKKKSRSLFFFIALIILIFLVFSNLLYPLYQHLPLINTSIRYRLIVLINFSLSILFGANIDDFFKNIEDYRRMIWRSIAIVTSSLVIYYIGVSKISNYDLSNSLMSQVVRIRIIVLIYVIVSVVTLLIKSRLLAQIGGLIIALLVIIDMGTFGNYYLPLVKDNASVIPTATDSLKYLEKNTKKQEKIAPLGDWTFFASSNMYYNLRDIRGHNFVYTNADMHSYYTAIDKSAYTTPTNIAFHSFDNENLLKYMGVKYTVSSLADQADRSASIGGMTPVSEIHKGIEITQSFTASKNYLSTIQLMVGTYNTKFRSDQQVRIQIIDSISKKVLRETETSLGNQADNSYMIFSFDSINDSKDKSYDVQITTNVEVPQKITFYASNEKNYTGDISIEGFRGNLVLLPFYTKSDMRIGDDELVVKEIGEYSNQIQLTDQIAIKDTDKEVLSSMKENYSGDVAYFSKEHPIPDIRSNVPLSDTEKINRVKNKNNGTITFDASVNEDRIVLINEYNDGNWSAYIDGKEVEVFKGNYLFRGIIIPKGSHKIEVRYKNSSLKKAFLIFWGTLIFILLLLVFKKRLERFVNLK